MHDRNFSCTTLAVVFSAVASTSWAHHGFGLFQMDIDKEWSGTLSKVDLVNPHSYMYFDSVDANGNVQPMRCEMRAATLVRRMGWTVDMFKPGAHVEVKGHPHRDDPGACWLDTIRLNDAVEVNRYQQLSSGTSVDTSNRSLRLALGEPNISGDWAAEVTLLTVPPSGGDAIRVPVSVREAFAKGEITFEEIRALDLLPFRSTPVYTEKGQAAADTFRNRSAEDNPRLSCMPTSIIFDWIFDWPVNRISQTTTAQGEKVIDIDYGLITNSRRIHMDMDSHPANIEPSNTGHSIGQWEGDTLVVDTVGFAEGVLNPPTYNSEQLHIVERYTLNTDNFTLRRNWTATDPVYLAEPYQGYDVVRLSNVPFENYRCLELTPEYQAP